jgi:hypothetical protein
MAQPPTYNRLTSFSNLTALSPSTPPPGNSLDAEFNAIKTTLDAMIVDFAAIQNDDTTVKNQSIGPAQLSSQLTTGFTTPTAWVTAHAYTASPASTVLHGTGMYVCLVSHTSSTFSTDLAAGKWLLIFDLSAIPIVAASAVTVAPSGLLTTNVQTSLEALDSGKAPTSHTHTVSQLSDSTADGRAFITTNLAGQKTLLSLGSLAFLNTIPVTSIGAQLAFTGKITPAALTTTTADWNPTGFATASVVEVSSTGPVALTGLQATTDGDIKFLDNVGPYNITLTGQDAGSSAPNRFAFVRQVILRPGNSCILKYDGLASEASWRLQSPQPTNPVVGSLKNLMIGNAGARNGFTAPGTPDTQFLITYDELVLEDANGETWRVTSGSHTISTATTGAVNGLESAFSLVSQSMFVWVIGNPTLNVIGGLLSLSATAPTVPSGYTFKARVGGTFTDASSHLLRTFQQGRQAAYVTDGTHVLPTVTSGATGTINTTTFTGTSTSLAGKVPTTAQSLRFATSGRAASFLMALAPNANYAGYQDTTGPVPFFYSFSSGLIGGAGEMLLESANIFYASANAAGLVQAQGWTDNL